MDKQAVISKIGRYLTGKDEILFAYLFGSFVNKQKYRDIDIAIYAQPKIELMDLGRLRAELTKCLGKKVDLTCLNGLKNKKPALAYNIVTQGELILNSDTEKHTVYKKYVLLNYFDTERLRNDIKKSFIRRLESDKFGHRNYE